MRGVPQGSLLGLVLFNTFNNNIDCGTETTLRNFVDVTKLVEAVTVPGSGRALVDDL